MPVNDLSTRMKNLLGNLSPGKKIMLALLVAATISGFIGMMLWAGKPDYHTLYTDLSLEDAGAIVEKLKEQKVPFQISANGTSVRIPREQVYETRLALASEGLPQSNAAGFELFDNAKLGMTEFVQNINYQRALQGELARTINRFTEVENSRVHIVMETKSLFVDQEKPATASVILKLRPGKWLTQDQIQGIVHLVATSVPGLKTENITVVDNLGKMLAGFKEDSGFRKATSDQLEYQKRVEETLEKRINTMLEKTLGPNKAVTRVSCSMDFNRQEMTEERYNPENRVVRSEQLLSENATGSGTIPMGVPGVASNLESQGTTEQQPASNRSFQKQDRTVNYEIGKLTSHTVKPIGEITKVSVAVVVDGSVQTVANKEGQPEEQYVPRSPEEMEKLESIVKRAVNFDAQRGDEIEVVNIPFNTQKDSLETEETFSDSWRDTIKNYSALIKYAFIGIFLIFTFLFVVRPLVRWLTTSPGPEGELLKQLPKTVDEIEKEYAVGSGITYADRAALMIAKDKDVSMGLMQDWLKEK